MWFSLECLPNILLASRQMILVMIAQMTVLDCKALDKMLLKNFHQSYLSSIFLSKTSDNGTHFACSESLSWSSKVFKRPPVRCPTKLNLSQRPIFIFESMLTKWSGSPLMKLSSSSSLRKASWKIDSNIYKVNQNWTFFNTNYSTLQIEIRRVFRTSPNMHDQAF